MSEAAEGAAATAPSDGAAFKSDDPRALREIVDRYSPSLMAIARAFTDDADEAKDLVQSTWIHAYERRLSLREDASFTGWLWVVCRSLCLSSVRRTTLQMSQYAKYSDDEVVGIASGSTQDALDVLESAEQRRDLMAAVAGLAPRQRDVVILRLLDGRSTRETAQLMGCREGTVKATLHQALKRLEQTLPGDGR